jgi:hypothetical protein
VFETPIRIRILEISAGLLAGLFLGQRAAGKGCRTFLRSLNTLEGVVRLLYLIIFIAKDGKNEGEDRGRESTVG